MKKYKEQNTIKTYKTMKTEENIDPAYNNVIKDRGFRPSLEYMLAEEIIKNLN